MDHDAYLDIFGRLYQIGKTQSYYKGFSHYVTNKNNEKFWNLFNEKEFRISENVISYRVINHWEKLGLIENLRSEEGSWRKYSLMDIIWIFIVKELRGFGLGLNNIKSIRKTLVSSVNQCEYGELEYYSALVLFQKVPVFVLAFSNYKAEVGTAYEILNSSDKLGILNHISINLNCILQSLFPKDDLKPIYEDYIELDETQQEILKTQKLENINEIILRINNGMTFFMEYTIIEPNESNIGRLKGKNSYQRIEITQHKGETTKVERKVSKKFNK